MENKTTIAAAGIPQDLVQWLDEQAKVQCTSRSTIIRQILSQRVNQEAHNPVESTDRRAA
jgi:metal-responsive CopG/Arc/MetJ family transcriptional regulator